MLILRDALLYSARSASGYSAACFSYESRGACPSTWSAAYVAHPEANSVLFKRSRTSCERILYERGETLLWMPALAAALENLLDIQVGLTGSPFRVTNSGSSASCLPPPAPSFHAR